MYQITRKFLLPLLVLFTVVQSSAVEAPYTDSTNLVVFGDSGKDNQGQLDVSMAMQEFCTREKCDYGALVGDVVYPTGVKSAKDPILETMFDKYYNPLNIPFIISLGNHDYGKLTLQWKRGYYHKLHAQKNPNYLFPHYYYVHETPEAVIAVLDTTRLMWIRSYTAQRKMVQAAYKRAQETGKWFFVQGHHPYLSNGKHGNAGYYEQFPLPFFASGRIVKKFFDRYVCGKAHFYLAGHDHSLQLMNGVQAGCETQLIVSGSGASSTKLYTRNFVEFESLEMGFFHVSIEAQNVHVKAVNSNAEVMFEKSYTKTR